MPMHGNLRNRAIFPLQIHNLPNGLGLNHDIEIAISWRKTFGCKNPELPMLVKNRTTASVENGFARKTHRPTKRKKRREQEKLHKRIDIKTHRFFALAKRINLQIPLKN